MNRVYLLLIILLSWPALAGEQPPSPLFVVHIETGPAWRRDVPPKAQTGFAEHAANMQRLRQQGIIAFGARYEEFGMLVFRVASEQEAKAIMDADPGVSGGIFNYRVAPLSVFYPWQQ
ncbi:hypothetical protein GCM10009092_09220 [Bowmanella denitrificans]|uniref:YCII-related domain-containing protein n=1 Tax=Bowmanella denitrificans TaxID=366582 RepID=A0ABP3GM59_9ALTE